MELFNENTICLDLQGRDKNAVIVEMVDLLNQAGILNDREIYKNAIIQREEQSTTGIGFGIAIPHAKSSAVKTARVALGIAKNGVDYKSDDGSLAHLIFMIAATEDAENLHLKMLAQLSRRLVDPVFRNQLLECETKQGVMELLAKI